MRKLLKNICHCEQSRPGATRSRLEAIPWGLLRLARNDRAFTLLEVLMAMAIFSIISIATVNQISLIRNTKAAAFEELDLYNGIRSAFSIIKSDLNQAFHWLYDDLGEEITKSIARNEKVPHTLFEGKKNEIVFTSLSNRNYYRGRRESEQAEITFFLKTKPGHSLPSLMKRQAGLIDGDLYAGGSAYTLLDDVSTLEFQFWDEKAAKWADKWNSDQGESRDRFPFAVKMVLGVINPNKKELKFTTVFKIAFPNNEGYLVKSF